MYKSVCKRVIEKVLYKFVLQSKFKLRNLFLMTFKIIIYNLFFECLDGAWFYYYFILNELFLSLHNFKRKRLQKKKIIKDINLYFAGPYNTVFNFLPNLQCPPAIRCRRNEVYSKTNGKTSRCPS